MGFLSVFDADKKKGLCSASMVYKNMKLPESIDHRIRLFKESGHAYMDSHDLFRVDSWAQVMIGQRAIPRGYHRVADGMDEKALKKYLEDFRNAVKEAVGQLPQHQDFINQYCLAGDVWKSGARVA